MAFTYVNSNSNTVDEPAVSSLGVALTGVTAGHLIAFWVKHEGAATTVTVSDGTSSLTGRTKFSHSNGDLHGQFFYLLVANGGDKTYTVTFGATRPFVRIYVFEYSYTGTASYDVEPTAGGAQGASTAPNSGNMTTTGTDEVCFGGYGEYSSVTFSAPLINAAAADGSIITATKAAAWRKVFASTFTGATSGTLSSSADWICMGVAFKAVAAAGGNTQPPRTMHQFRQRNAA